MIASTTKRGIMIMENKIKILLTKINTLNEISLSGGNTEDYLDTVMAEITNDSELFPVLVEVQSKFEEQA